MSSGRYVFASASRDKRPLSYRSITAKAVNCFVTDAMVNRVDMLFFTPIPDIGSPLHEAAKKLAEGVNNALSGLKKDSE